MHWFRDIWAEVVAAGVLAAMTMIIGIIQDTNPIIVAAISFAIILSTFRVVYYFQERKLKMRLGIEKSKWNKIREEKIRLRKPYENCLKISKVLFQMHNHSVRITKEQLKKDISKKEWEKIALDVKRVLPKLTITSMLLLPKMHRLGKRAWVQKIILSFLLDVTAVLKKHGYGSLEAENDGEYSRLYEVVKDYENGLPPQICDQIEGNILLSKILSTMQVFEPSQPALRKLNLNSGDVNKFQYLLPATHMMLNRSRGNIHNSIENWLTGG